MTSTSAFTPLDRLLQLQLNMRGTERAFNIHVLPQPEGIRLIVTGSGSVWLVFATAAPDLHSAAASINFHELERQLSTP